MTQPMYGDYRDLQCSTVTCQYIGPVADQLRFAVVFQDSVFPALGFQQINQRLLKAASLLNAIVEVLLVS